jgi:hypothetical protein
MENPSLKPTAHLAASAVLSGTVYFLTKSVTVAGVSFFTGFLIDVDHVVDYFREYGFRGDVKEFFRVFYETRFKKLLLLFHAWEWVAGLSVLAWISGRNEIILGLLIGAGQHLLLDQFFNEVAPWGYFFTYRVAKRFLVNEIVRKEQVPGKRKQ